MQTSLYNITIPVFIKSLQNLSGILDKGVMHAENKKFDTKTLLSSRLAPDQFPFVKQVQITCDTAKGYAPRIMGVDAVVVEDNETSIEELKARIDKTIEILKTVKPEDVDGKEDVEVRMPKYYPGQHINGFDVTMQFTLPNFFFHLTTAYAILRHNGVDLGKSDYLGQLSFKDDVA